MNLNKRALAISVCVCGIVSTAATAAAISLFPIGGDITLQRMWVYGFLGGAATALLGVLMAESEE